MQEKTWRWVLLGVVAVFLIGTMGSPHYGNTWSAIHVPLDVLAPIGTEDGGPARAKFRDDGSGSDGVFALQFGASENGEHSSAFSIRMPHNWYEGSQICVWIDWTPGDVATACNFRICTEGLTSVNGVWPVNTTINCVILANNALISQKQRLDLCIQPGTGMKIGDESKQRVFRDSKHGDDTCTNEYLWIHSVGFRYRIDRPGSRQETVK